MGRIAARIALAVLLLVTAGPVLAKQRTVLAATPISRTDLTWWRARHEAKVAELHNKRPDLVFLGDSITQQWEKHGPPDWMDFKPVWDRYYGKRNAVNLGFTGDTTANLLWRIENGQASGIAPKVAVVLIGANNLGRLRWSAEDTLLGIDAIIRALQRRLPETRVLLLGVLPSDRNEWATETTIAINRGLASKYAGGGMVTFLDIGHVFMRNGKLNRDLYYDPRLNPPAAPLHPTAQGQALMAEGIEPILSRLIGDRRP